MTEASLCYRREPKLYSPVIIRFSSLRNRIGANGGVILDVDVMVARKCRRVLCDDGWKWQIINGATMAECSINIQADMETLDEYGSELEYEIVKGAQ